jgi:glucans biosynthesis protein C
MNTTPSSSSRRYDFDWLRVLLILTVFVFHSLHFFDSRDWHVKISTESIAADIGMTFLSRWMMPSIFIVSGAATYYALGKGKERKYLKDRTLRLAVPLVFGLFTHVILQGYLEGLNHKTFAGSFWEFYATRFNGLDRLGGNFNWIGNHLWYLEMLFIFSLICLPLFIWLKTGAGRPFLDWLGRVLSAPGAIYLMILPTMILALLLNPKSGSILTSEDFGGWNIINHLVFFLFGFLLGSSEKIQEAIRRVRWISLPVGIIVFLAGGAAYFILGDRPFNSVEYKLMMITSSVIAWTWILTIFGFGMGRLNFRNAFLDYAGEAVMPFYLLHQSVLLVVGYLAVDWAMPDFLKWVFILLVSFALIMGLYEIVIRRVNVLRVLFGMKPVRKERVVVKPAVQVS